MAKKNETTHVKCVRLLAAEQKKTEKANTAILKLLNTIQIRQRDVEDVLYNDNLNESKKLIKIEKINTKLGDILDRHLPG